MSRFEEIGAALDLDAADVSPPTPRTPCVLPRGYTLDSEGLCYQGPDRDGEPASRMWLCAPFDVVGFARDGDGEGWALVIEFRDEDRRLKQEVIARAELATDGAEVRRRLLSRGLVLAASPKARTPLLTALQGLKTSSRVRLEHSTGWKGDLYVLPHRTIGGGLSEPVLFQGRSGSYHAEKGSFETWRAEVAALMVGNPAGVFALSTAFAAPLLRDLGGEGGGFHFRGPSSCGKSTLQRIAGSAWGGGGRQGFSQSWRHTDNALDAVALAHNDGLLCLDEIKQVGAEAAGQIAYSLASGIQKGRLRPDGDARDKQTWCTLILSSGEMSLSDLARSGRNPRERSYAGQELRLLDISAEFHAEQGVWERLPAGGGGKGAAAVFSVRLKSATEEHFGFAGPAFVARYVADRAALQERAVRFREAFLAQVLEPQDSSQIRRGADRFALVAAAGELAAALDVVPWPPGEAMEGVAAVFRRWASAFGRTARHEDREMITRLRDFLQRYEHSRFRVRKGPGAEEDAMYDQAKGLKARQGEARSLDAAGWRDDEDGGTVFHIFPAVWRDIFSGMDGVAAAKIVRAAGHLVSNGGRLQNRVKIGGLAPSFYSVRGAIMADDGEFTVHGAGAETGTEKGELAQAVHSVRTELDDETKARFEERAAVLEHDAGLSRPEAEARARAELGL